MKKIFFIASVSIIFALISSCSDDDLNLPKNQIGEWEGLRIVHNFKNSSTISRDSSEVSIILNRDGGGIFENKPIIQWKKENNEFTNREKILIETENSFGNVEVKYSIFLDEQNRQEWGLSDFFPIDSTSRETKWLLNRVE